MTGTPKAYRPAARPPLLLQHLRLEFGSWNCSKVDEEKEKCASVCSEIKDNLNMKQRKAFIALTVRRDLKRTYVVELNMLIRTKQRVTRRTIRAGTISYNKMKMENTLKV